MEDKTQDQIEIYKSLTDLIMKIIFGAVALIFFIWIAIRLLTTECSLLESVPTAVFGIVLSISASPVYRHLFPSSK